MIYPIVAYGTEVLRKKAQPISKDYLGLQELIDNIKDAAGDTGDKIKSKFGDVQEDVSGLIKKGKRFINDLQRNAKETFE